MNRVLAVVTVVSLFVAGIAIGALGMHIYHDRHLLHPGESPGPGRGLVTRRLHRQLERSLDLSADQQRTIDAILQRSHEEAMELRRDVHPQVTAIMDRAHEEIADILDPEQREAFQQTLRDNHRRAEHFFLGPPGRGRGRHRPWGGPGHRPWSPPPSDSAPADPPPDWPDDAIPDHPSALSPDQPEAPGRD